MTDGQQPGPDPRPKPDDRDERGPRMPRGIIIWLVVVVLVVMLTSFSRYDPFGKGPRGLTLQEFNHEVEAGTVRRASVQGRVITGELAPGGKTTKFRLSVTERYREIGTLKCLGALDTFVVRLFLVESIFVGVLASVAGGVVGYALALLQVGAVLEFGVLDVSVCASACAVALPAAVGLGTALTTLAAIYPTYVAARMKPADAMRSEV